MTILELKRQTRREQGSSLEREMAFQIRAAKLPIPAREHQFCNRKWRFDFAWPLQRIGLEVHGATYANGRHTRGNGFAEDRRKMNMAQLMGWKVLEFDSAMVKTGEALQTLESALNVETPLMDAG